MRIWMLVVSAFVVTASSGLAQSPPAKELEKFQPLIGSWKSTGTFRMSPESPEAPWTAVITFSRVLGGHFIQEDMRLELGMPVPMLSRTIYSWDAARGACRRFMVTNTGEVHTDHVYWHGDKFVGGYLTDLEGVPVCDRVVTTITKDGYRMLVERSIGGGAFFTMITGTSKRHDESFSVDDSAASESLAPVAEAMQKMAKQVGSYQVAGEMILMPGMAKMPVRGKETIRSILGGHVQLAEIQGDPMPGNEIGFQGRVLTAWDAKLGHFRAIEIGNFGDYVEYEARPEGDHKTVWSASTTTYGLPQVKRTVVTQSEDGREIQVVTHRLAGIHSPEKSFEITLRRLGD